MQPSLRSLVPFTFVAFARASPFEARSGSSSISVPVADGFTALASQARPGSELAGSKINGGGTTGAVTHAGAQLHNLTANAAQFDVYFYVCNGQNCQGGCEYFHLNNYAANVCYTVNSFPFLSGFIQDANTPLPYGVGSFSRLVQACADLFLYCIGFRQPLYGLFSTYSARAGTDVLQLRV
jgi:hypothetical protein